MTLRHRILIIGGVMGVAGATISVCLAAWFGIVVGASLGMLIAVLLGALATHTATQVFEQCLLDHLVVSDANDWTLPGSNPESGNNLLETLSLLRHSHRRVRQLETELEEITRLAHSFCSSMAAGEGTNGPAASSAAACITTVLDTFRQSTDTLVRYVNSLEEANERMASGALDQTETVSRTTTTVEALSENIDRISQNAENASEACERTRHEARLGLEQVHQVVEGMERLRSQIEINGRKARRLGDRSVEIGTIVELIRGISSRTDMLALNATIESVRAGEHGRGFAVVAEEIRKLAERTAGATRDISTLVEAIQADTHESIRALNEEQTEMEQESQRVREAGSALERISQVAENSAQLVDGISKSTNEQVLAAQELVRAMQRISDVSNLTEERTTQSRESIRALAQSIQRLAPALVTPDPITTARGNGEEGSEGPSPMGLMRRKRRLVGSERPL